MRNVITVIKNTVEGFNNRLEEAEDQISDLKDKVEKAPTQSSKWKKNQEDSLHYHWDNMKNNIHIIGEWVESEKVRENLFEEIMAENFSYLVKEKNHSSSGNTESPNKDESLKTYI